ncbi:MAG: hypothetical protein ACO1O1_01620 [Adhaeribacter sp.]
MEGIKKIVNILVMLYLVAATLIYLGILNVGQASNPGFYTGFFVVGGILMLLELIVENLYIASLKRGHGQTLHKINELKANLYDHQQQIQDMRNRQAAADAAAAAAATAATVPQPAAPAAGAAYTTAPAPVTEAAAVPLTAAPTGTDPVPQVVKPAEENPSRVIITPSPTPGIQDPERRLPENTDT